MSDFTIRDMQSLYPPYALRLLAGQAGLGRAVTKCGILDYEYDPQVKDKYYHTNFEPGQLVLTSFLYARDNAFLILEGVKNLVSRGCSGLVVKNIFKLPIQDSVLRYADSKNFPLFVLKDHTVYFEDIIFDVTGQIAARQAPDWASAQIDRLLAFAHSPRESAQLAQQLNPSFLSQVQCLYFYCPSPFAAEDFVPYQLAAQKAGLLLYQHTLAPFKNGILYIGTGEFAENGWAQTAAQALLQCWNVLPHRFYAGSSLIHHQLQQLPKAIQQSITAALLHPQPESPLTQFADLGSFQLLFSLQEDSRLESYSSPIIKALQDYDAENNTRLFETCLRFVLAGGSLPQTAQSLGQHENTLRYRLNQIGQLLELDLYSRQGYSLFSLACQIHICKFASSHFGQPPYDWMVSLLPC